MDKTIKQIGKEEIKTFVSLWDSFKDLVKEIKEYIPKILLPKRFNVNSWNFEITEKFLVIVLYDWYNGDNDRLYVPLEYIMNGTWKEYINKEEDKAIEAEKKRMEEEKMENEREELAELRRLKAKYEIN